MEIVRLHYRLILFICVYYCLKSFFSNSLPCYVPFPNLAPSRVQGLESIIAGLYSVKVVIVVWFTQKQLCAEHLLFKVWLVSKATSHPHQPPVMLMIKTMNWFLMR